MNGDLTLSLGKDPDVDQMVAAVVRFGETRLRDGDTPGEVELELAARGVDEQIAASAVPYLEILYERLQLERGFHAWRKSRPITDLFKLMGREAAEAVTLILGVGIITLLAWRFGNWLIQFMELGLVVVVFVLTPVVLYGLTHVNFLISRVASRLKVSRLWRQLEHIEARASKEEGDRDHEVLTDRI